MANKRKWLDGELKYAEGKAPTATLLKAIASELVEQGWVDYPKNGATDYWGFNSLRQITLHTETTKSNIRLYDSEKTVSPNGDETFSKGELINPDSYKIIGRVIEGVDGTDGDKTKRGDFVFIEMIHTDVQFQQTTFLKHSGINGAESIQAKLKSVPKGDLTLYEDTLVRTEGEVLLNKNDNGLVFNVGRAPISMSRENTKKLIVKVDGVISDEVDYEVDYFNGNIIFKNYTEGEVTADYSIATGERGDEIDSEKYSIMGDRIFANEPNLENTDIIVDISYFWNIHYPASVNQIDDRVIFKTKVDVSPDKSKNAFKTFYWELGKFDFDVPTIERIKEEMFTYNNRKFFTKYDNLKLVDEEGEPLHKVYIDGVPQEVGSYTINKDGEVIFPTEQGGDVTDLSEELKSEDFKEYKLANSNIIEGSLTIQVDKDNPETSYKIDLNGGEVKVDYQTGELVFKEEQVGGGQRQSATKTGEYTYSITTNDNLHEVEKIIVDGYGALTEDREYTVDLEAKTIKLKENYFPEEPSSIICWFATTATLHVEYKWSNLVEVDYSYYVKEESPLFDEAMKGSDEFADYVTGFRSRYSSKLESPMPSDDYNSGHYRLNPHHVSPWSKWSWYRKKAVLNEEVKLGTWTPVKFYMNFTKEYVNIVLQGEHSVDSHPYKNYIISYAYVGALENYQCSIDDAVNNFAMTVGSDELYDRVFYDKFDDGRVDEDAEAEDGKGDVEFLPELWGHKTGTGVTDISMERTHSNLPFQAHYPAFYTNPEFLDKHFISVSESTKKHHFSPITIVHGTERERGKMQSVVIGDRSAIFHLDELIEHRDEFNSEDALVDCKGRFLDECNLPMKSKEKKYIQFNINAPYWFANNSPNTLYGLAIRKS